MTRLHTIILAFAVLSLAACRQSPGEPPNEGPILVDHRPLLEIQDLSGLEAGTHVVEFDAYVPRREQWTSHREQQLIRAIRVAHVATRAPAVTRVGFKEIPGRADMRRVSVEMDLSEQGTWVVRVYGGDVFFVENESYVAQSYEIREPETLLRFSEFAHLYPSILLRTIGSCNHVHKVMTAADEHGVLRQLKLFFSEQASPTEWAEGLRLSLLDEHGNRQATVAAVNPRGALRVMEFDMPELPGARGTLQVQLGSPAELAGGFHEQFSCAQAAATVNVRYAHGEQRALEQLVTQISVAVERAFDESK